MPRLRLPPLPPPAEWNETVWVKGIRGEGAGSRESGKRVLLGSPKVTNEFVRQLGIRKNEVVIDAYCGPGQLTRALLAGGYDETTPADWKRVVKEQEEKGLPIGPVAANTKRRRSHSPPFDYPPWKVTDTNRSVKAIPAVTEPATAVKRGRPKKQSEDEAPPAVEAEPVVKPKGRPKKQVSEESVPEVQPKGGSKKKTLKAPTETAEDAVDDEKKSRGRPKAGASVYPSVVTPRFVVANDPKVSALCRGLGFDQDQIPPSKWEMDDVPQPGAQAPKSLGELENTVFPSPLQPNLGISPTTMYRWPTAPMILRDPLVAKHLEVYDESKGLSDRAKRPWEAPAPPITFVATIPDAVFGDQLVNQWIMSATSSDVNGKRSWIWEWGRVRLALLVNRSIYDRLMAPVGAVHYGKQSVMANALFDLRALPPLHHVRDPHNLQERTKSKLEFRKGKHELVPGETPEFAERRNDARWWLGGATLGKLTPTYAGDFYPIKETLAAPRACKPDLRLVRPHLLGIEMIPKANPLVTSGQRETWDYVLRKMFVRATLKVGEALPALAFGADNLVDKIMAPNNGYAGKPLMPDRVIRELTIEEWQRIVDVFDKWAFKPENMITDGIDLDLEESREVGLT